MNKGPGPKDMLLSFIAPAHGTKIISNSIPKERKESVKRNTPGNFGNLKVAPNSGIAKAIARSKGRGLYK